MRTIILILTLTACSPATMASLDSGSDAVRDAGTPDAAETDTWLPDAADAGTAPDAPDASTPQDSGTEPSDAPDTSVPDAPDAPADAPPPPASIVEVSDSHCALDAAGVWRCWVGTVVRNLGSGWVQIGGTCAIRSDGTGACLDTAGLLELGPVPGDIVGHSRADNGCATDGSRHLCWQRAPSFRTCTVSAFASGVYDIILPPDGVAVCDGGSGVGIAPAPTPILVDTGWSFHPRTGTDVVCRLGWTSEVVSGFTLLDCWSRTGLPSLTAADGSDYQIAVDTTCGIFGDHLRCATSRFNASSATPPVDLGVASAYGIGYDEDLRVLGYATAAEVCAASGTTITCYAFDVLGTSIITGSVSW